MDVLNWIRTASGLWDLLLQALGDGGGTADALQMIDSTIIRAHHLCPAPKRRLKASLLAARAATA